MKIIAIFFALLAVSLAAPSEVAKAVAPEKTESEEKLVEKVEAVSPSSDSPNENKAEVSEVANSEGEIPVVTVVDSEEEKKDDEGTKKNEEIQNLKHEYAAICRASTGATEEQIIAIDKEPVADAPTAVKCYVKCMSEHFGFSQDELVQREVALKNKPSTITTEEFETVLDTCVDVKTDDPCDSAYLRYSCFFRTSGEKIRLN